MTPSHRLGRMCAAAALVGAIALQGTRLRHERWAVANAADNAAARYSPLDQINAIGGQQHAAEFVAFALL